MMKTWMQSMGEISRGMLFLRGHFVSLQGLDVSARRPAPGKTQPARKQQRMASPGKRSTGTCHA